MPLEKVVTDSYSKSSIDIDDFYKHRIKGIYGEIIDFSTKAQSQMAPEDIEELYAIIITRPTVIEVVRDYHDASLHSTSGDKKITL